MKVNSGEDNYVIEVENEEEAYQTIRDKLGIKPVQITDIPIKARFQKAVIEDELKVAEIYYQYQGDSITYIINGDRAKNSIGVNVEDEILENYTLEVEGKMCIRDRGSSTKKAEAEAMALTLCSLLAVPAITQAAAQVILLAWAYGECLMDVRALLNKGKVPLMKNEESWQLSLSDLLKLGQDKSLNDGQDTGSGLTYEDVYKRQAFHSFLPNRLK